MCLDLIAGRLFGHYIHGGVYPAFLSRNLFVCSVWYFCVKGKTSSLGGMLHMSND